VLIVYRLFTAFPRQRQLFQITGLLISTVALIATGFVTAPAHLVVTMGILYPMSGGEYAEAAQQLGRCVSIPEMPFF